MLWTFERHYISAVYLAFLPDGKTIGSTGYGGGDASLLDLSGRVITMEFFSRSPLAPSPPTIIEQCLYL
jgi:hypothetical protein